MQGVGKTYLLHEYRLESAADGVACVRIDFSESSNHNYLEIVRAIRNEFHGESFKQLDETVRQTRALGRWEHVLTQPVAPGAPEMVLRPDPSSARSGGIDFSGPTEVDGGVAGRDINYIFQIIQRDDPVVQAEIQDRITEALLECLARLTGTHPLAFLFDSWELAPTTIRDWISSKLLNCILEKKLLISIAVIAGSQLPDFRHMPRRIQHLMMPGLSEEEVRIYWVEKRGLSLEDVPQVFRLTKGLPVAVALLADMQTLPTPTLA